MTEYLVGTITRQDAPTLEPATPIRRAAALLVEARAAAAAVLTPEGRLEGILTQKDCFRSALHASYYQEWTGTVGDFMSREVVGVETGEEVIHVAELFATCPHRVLVVTEGGRYAGLVHRSDVLALLVRIG